jgi:hypothetical protein
MSRVSPEKVGNFLAQLPKEAWPYGKIVGVMEAGLRSGNDDKLIQENLDRTLKSLKELGIEARLWPSA